jgi:Domain of unknown function (DUF4328)
MSDVTPPPPPPPNMTPPPGYVAYGGSSQGAFGSFNRVGGVGRTIGILVMIFIPLQILSTVVLLSIRGKAQDYLNGSISQSEFEDSSRLTGVTGLLSFAIFVALIVLTMVWMYRLAKNAKAMDRVGTWTPGWAIGSWFLPPFALYVLPYLMLRDLWKASEPESNYDWRRNPVAPIVHIWWVLYGLLPIAFFSVTFASFRVSSSTRDLAKTLDDTFALSVASGLVQILASVSYLLLVRQLTARHMRVTGEH